MTTDRATAVATKTAAEAITETHHMDREAVSAEAIEVIEEAAVVDVDVEAEGPLSIEAWMIPTEARAMMDPMLFTELPTATLRFEIATTKLFALFCYALLALAFEKWTASSRR